jgi:hypothetical protein
MTSLDTTYPEWRKHTDAIQEAARKDPTLTTIRSAYERVLATQQAAEIRRLRTQVTAFQRKTGVEGDSALNAANVTGSGQVTQKKVYENTPAGEMEAILDAVKRAEEMRRGK